MSIPPNSTAGSFNEEWWIDKKRESELRADMHAHLAPVRAAYRRASAHRRAKMLADIDAYITDGPEG